MNFEKFAAFAVLAESNQIVTVIDRNMVVRWISESSEVYDFDAVGKSIAELVHPDDIARAALAFEIAPHLEEREMSLMTNPIIPVRVLSASGVIAFDASGRWRTDENGEWWLVVILHDVSTRFAGAVALRALAAGASEKESVRAILNASHTYGGVTGSQMVWYRTDRTIQTMGDLGVDVPNIKELLGDPSELPRRGSSIQILGSDWGYVIPVSAGSERLGALAMWGSGAPPMDDFVPAAFDQLLDLAALAFKRSRELAELERQATTDLVTGLLNRHAFFSALDEPLLSSAMIYIDLDGFKSVNDDFGHTLGDRLLGVVSRRLADAVGEDDLIGRLGGDEFGVLSRGVSAADAEAAGARIVEALNQTFVLDNHRIETGASVGVAYAEGAADGRALLDQADQALLEAKAQGKGQAVVLGGAGH